MADIRYGRREPRIFTPPLRTLEPRTPETEQRTLGYSVIDFAAHILGLNLWPWQEWFFIHALELREDGRLRFKTLLLLVARQNGKSTISQVLALFVLYVLRWRMVLGTAQDLDTAEAVWDEAVSMIQATDEDDDGEEYLLRPELAAEVRQVVQVNGKKALVLTDRRRWKVKTAGRGAGRGFSGDLVMVDELREHRNWLAWGAITKTTMARPHALVFALSNAGDVSSVVLKSLRRTAHLALGDPDGIAQVSALEAFTQEAETADAGVESDDESLFIAEWSTPPGLDKWNRDGWAWGNPSLGWMIQEESIAAACRTDPEWVFRTEVLCQWPEGAIEGPYPPGRWDACANVPVDGPTGPALAPEDVLTGPLVACVAVSADQSRAHVVVAGVRADGRPQVEVRASRVGTHWVEAFLSDPKVSRRITCVTGHSRGASSAPLIQELRDSEDFKLPVVEWSGPHFLNAHASFLQRVSRGELAHNAQPALDAAASMASTRNLGGVDVIDLRESPCDASPLLAAIGAVWLLDHQPVVEAFEMPPLPVVAVLTDRSASHELDAATIRF